MARSRLGPDDKKGMTGIHRRLAKVISQFGTNVENEYPFPPYQVDIYLPEYHMAFEADGQGHLKSRDDKRDTILMEKYGLVVIRFSNKEITTEDLGPRIMEAIEKHCGDVKKRKSVWLSM